ncbi:hypothetical protein B0H17DRAFT_1095735 [Mycena rosella]|uniref:Metal homeostatis protein bsd2 n=1 Tax=Mycena rosella TaxID=1033263 RepID=A0AAD7CRQ5_MYCRO|nr:hypothetical protein B0H17DRAFT_1095735 [Mycena rosella]
MSSARYAPLSRSAQDADRELDDAFAGDDDNDAPLGPSPAPAHVPGAYDFEREYDCPPPGSPPRPSALALPNDIGNSNGQLPTDAVAPRAPRPSFFRRAVGAVLPSHYTRLPTSDAAAGVRFGGGIENDGVFANVMAKPQRARTAVTEDGEIYMVPEDNQKEPPPVTMRLAAVSGIRPPYWETTVHAPGMDSGDMMIDDLPSGSLWVFLGNMFISFFFQFVGFLLTFLLHTSHAAKYGGRAGLGLTLIQYGFYSRGGAGGAADVVGVEDDEDPTWPTLTPNAVPAEPEATPTPTDAVDMSFGVTSRDWISFLLMTIGWFLLLSSFIGFWRIKRWEASIRSASSAAPITQEDLERDAAVRRNLEAVFGISFAPDGEQRQPLRRDENGALVAIPTQELLEEARLARDLRAAGLL